MTMQKPLHAEDGYYKRKLFYDNGIRYIEVKAKQIVEYQPPSPVMKASATEHIMTSAGLISQGTSHYTTKLTMLFYSKQDYAEWLQFVGSKHKYYDEKGTIYLGVVTGQPNIQTAEFETKYIVSVELALIRKQDFDYRHQYTFVDIEDHWAKQYIDEMHQRGLIAQYWNDGSGVQYFRPEDKLIRAEMAALLVRTYKYLDRILRGF